MAKSNNNNPEPTVRNLMTMSRTEYAQFLKDRVGGIPTYQLTPTSSPAPLWSKMNAKQKKAAQILKNL
jgi:hypothetical protein